MIARRRVTEKDKPRKIGTRLGAVRLASVDTNDVGGSHPQRQPSSSVRKQVVMEASESQCEPEETHDSASAPCVAAVDGGQETPWDLVQDAFRRLADGKIDGNSPLNLDSLVPMRPALLVKGLGAINAMGKAAVQVANSLDDAVEHLFEGWSVSPPAEKRAGSSIEKREQQTSNCPEKDRRPAVLNGASSTRQSETRQQKQQRIRKLRLDKPSKETSCSPRESPVQQEEPGARQEREGLNEWRVKQLQEELQALRTTQNEYLQLREQLNKVQAELTYTSNKCSALSQENELLRGQPRMPPCPVEEADPLSEQVAAQLQALLEEKAKLASDNARLAFENSSLQELLEYTVSAVEEDPCFEDGSSCHMNSEAEWEPGQEHMDVAADLLDSCPSPSME
ncbi:hypothetical protein COCOBI_01-1460 [Coccomyxa sp. Obi]|nr:hypothetical protein COCOBI_01-1460 [Coccomyxa sp. Obi]